MNRTVVLSGIVSFAMAFIGAAVAVSVVVPGSASAQPPPPALPDRQEVSPDQRFEQSVLVSDNGSDRVHLFAGGPQNYGALRIFDTNGQLRVHVEASDDLDGNVGQGVALWNGVTPIVRLGSVGRSVELAGRSLSQSNLVLRDDTGKDRIRLLVADDGTPTLELIGNVETLVWTVP
jgi:hypothetical protein